MVPKLVQACSICNEPIHAVLELVHACSICNEPIHMVPKLVRPVLFAADLYIWFQN